MTTEIIKKITYMEAYIDKSTVCNLMMDVLRFASTTQTKER